MAQNAHLSLKPMSWKQAYQWFTETETYSFNLFLKRAPLTFDKKNIAKVYSVQMPKERYFIVEFQDYKIRNHLKLSAEQFRALNTISEFHPQETKEDPVHTQVRSDYLRWSIFRSPSLSFMLAMILLTVLFAQLKSAWISNIQEGFWLVSTYCAVSCSKEFAQFVVLLLYLHGVLGLSLFWGPLHYMATYRLHRLSAQRFFSLIEATILSILGVIFFSSSFEYQRIEQAAQIYVEYRRGDFGQEKENAELEEESTEELASEELPEPIPPPSQKAKQTKRTPSQEKNDPETTASTKTDTPMLNEPQDTSSPHALSN